jgi:Flp pilus assembly pilin Flp
VQTIIEYAVIATIAVTVLIRLIALVVFSRKDRRR